MKPRLFTLGFNSLQPRSVEMIVDQPFGWLEAPVPSVYESP